MKSPRADKHPARPLILASAALLIQFGSAAAADLSGDAQGAARALLAPAITQRAPPVAVASAPGTAAGLSVDAQEHARLLLSGALAAAPASRQIRSASMARRSHADVQTLAQRLITGKRDGAQLE
jgi:hypothetical protein